MNICLSGYYFVGSRGDEVLRKIIIRDLIQFGKVKVICCESRNFEKVIDWCDVFVLGGGTLINSRGIGGYDQVKYAKQKRKKIMLYANTIEDGDPKFHEFMKCVDGITVRDSQSHMLCTSHGYKCTLAADPAIKIFNKKHIHVGLRNWVIEPDDFVIRIARVLDELANKYTLILTPYTLKHTDTISDIQFSRRVREKMKTKIKIKNFRKKTRPDLFIGMRLHSIIATIKQTIPIIAINYDGKIGNFMRDVGKEEFLVEYNTIEKIPEIVSNLFLEELIERERKNIEVFRALMKR